MYSATARARRSSSERETEKEGAEYLRGGGREPQKSDEEARTQQCILSSLSLAGTAMGCPISSPRDSEVTVRRSDSRGGNLRRRKDEVSGCGRRLDCALTGSGRRVRPESVILDGLEPNSDLSTPSRAFLINIEINII